ncbi:MAG: arginase family protein [Chloroflexota bacterium]
MSSKPVMNDLFGGQSEGGFLGIPSADIGVVGDAKIVILGVPTATPYPSVGAYCAEAPDTIRNAMGWPGILGHHDFDLGGPILPEGVGAMDWGNLRYGEDAAFNRQQVSATVKSILNGDAVPLVLGGDDSVVTPVLQAYAEHGPITILQIDAHIDWRDNVNGEQWGLSSTMRRASEMPWVEQIVLVGARSIGSARTADYQHALSTGATFFPMREFRRQGIGSVLDAIPAEANLFITLDVDGLDPTIMPSVIGPAPGGLTYWDFVELVTGAAEKSRSIVGFDIVELLPDADIDGQGARLAARIVATMIGVIGRQFE